ncbi:PREDICTED: acylamino-acid-releasing enzyme-like, partial [Priapulus caudatus]|uniref:Acylamino-acid-releasing enzyme-like n=1 Tax=Priapulus caudatus TaxID=37621 RepID=A0ABM1F5P0_PRICU
RLAKLLPAGGEGNINWFDLDPATLLDDLTWEVQVFQPKCVNPDYPDLHFEGILILPKPSETEKEGSKAGEAGKPPLIIFPHGGPHSVHLAGWNLYVAGFARLGFAMMLVNYRGSTGFGDDGIFSLLGNCGKQDVADCQQCADELVASGVVDGNRVVCFGGSYGGFLVAHLIGRYPDFYKAAECRNPVTNIATKLGGSDIPDWSYVEGGLGAFHFGRVPTPADLEKMLNDSPIVLADKMKTPLLLMIGGADKMVPPQQGHELQSTEGETRARQDVRCRRRPRPLQGRPGGGPVCANQPLVPAVHRVLRRRRRRHRSGGRLDSNLRAAAMFDSSYARAYLCTVAMFDSSYARAYLRMAAMFDSSYARAYLRTAAIFYLSFARTWFCGGVFPGDCGSQRHS